jgi:predicted RNA-binding Zn ribbon-like protein
MTEFRTGYGAAWLDLLASLTGRYLETTRELLPDPEAARRWFAEHDLEPVAPVTEADLEALRALREAVHRTAAATVRGDRPTDSDLWIIDRALADDRPGRLELGASELGASDLGAVDSGAADTGRLVLSRPRTAAEAAGRLARHAVDDMSGPRRELLRFCGDSDCAGIFLDHTGRRRWCADERCGVRARVRAHRARARGPAGQVTAGQES